MIEWHRVTWYSKLAAVIFFIGLLPIWTFYIGMQYEKTREVLSSADLQQITLYKVPGKTTAGSVGSTGSTSSGTGVSTQDSGVEGIVTIGPTCPVERIPPDPACDDKPYQTTLVIASTIIGRNGGILVKTDVQGHYKATLSPGKYTIRAQSTAVLPRLEPITFLVQEHKYTELNFSFDSGIR